MSTFPFVTSDEGAATHVYTAFAPEVAGECIFTTFGSLPAPDGAGNSPRLTRPVLTRVFDAELNGGYFQKCQPADAWADRIKAWACSEVEAERLWKLSEEFVGQTFDY